MKTVERFALVAFVPCVSWVLAGCEESAAEVEAGAAPEAGPLAAQAAGDAAAQSPAWLADVQRRLANEEYRINGANGVFHAVNRAHNLRAEFEGGRVRVTARDGAAADGDWTLTLAVAGMGRTAGEGPGARRPRMALGPCDEW